MKLSALFLSLLLTTTALAQGAEEEPTPVQRVMTFEGMSGHEIEDVVAVFSEATVLRVYERGGTAYARLSGFPKELDALEAAVQDIVKAPAEQKRQLPGPMAYQLTYYVVMGSSAPVPVTGSSLPLPDAILKAIQDADPVTGQLELRLLDTNLTSLLVKPEGFDRGGSIRATGFTSVTGHITSLELDGHPASVFYNAEIKSFALSNEAGRTAISGESRIQFLTPYAMTRYAKDGAAQRFMEYKDTGASTSIMLDTDRPHVLGKVSFGEAGQSAYIVAVVSSQT